MKLEHFSGLLLMLHNGARKLAITDFREWALHLVRPVLRFDTALWGRYGHTQSEALCGGSLYRHGRPDHVARGERACHPEGPLAKALKDRADMTINLSLADGDTGMVELAAPPTAIATQKLLHVLCTGIDDPASRTCSWLAVFRNDPAERFSERERLLKQALTPHLIAAWHANRAWYLAQIDPDRPARRQSWAIVDQLGVVQEVTPRFRSTVSREWPGWDGSQLPPGVIEPLLNAEGTRLASAHLLFESFPIHNLYFVKVRQKKPSDCLSSREQLVAELFREGLTYKEIAKRLAIAPTTVRAHLRGIYSKLGVTSKLGLVATLS